MRVAPHEFQRRPLRVHDFLADVPLHDVWLARLHGALGPRSMQRVLSLFAGPALEQASPIVRLLFAVRRLAGRVFGWDAEVTDPERSYIGRLAPEDRERSRLAPGTRQGPFRIVYVLENEAVTEVINKTVHAFLVFALEPGEGDMRLYLAVYVKPVSRMTAVYMAAIDPFRRIWVYPALIRRIERSWNAAAR